MIFAADYPLCDVRCLQVFCWQKIINPLGPKPQNFPERSWNYCLSNQISWAQLTIPKWGTKEKVLNQFVEADVQIYIKFKFTASLINKASWHLKLVCKLTCVKFKFIVLLINEPNSQCLNEGIKNIFHKPHFLFLSNLWMNL